MRSYLVLFFSVFCFSVNPVMAQDEYDFEEILGIKMGEKVNSIKNLDQYGQSEYEDQELDERGCSFGRNFRQYWKNEIVEDSPERMLLNLSTINDVITYLDIILIKKSDDKFNNFIDQVFFLFVTKWGEPTFSDGSYNVFSDKEYLESGYHFKPDADAIKSILYNQYGDETDDYRTITITYKSKAYLDAKDAFLDCSFSFK
ncbi:MAG TPA: hypothetical protein H9889_05955 [Candidatus Ignatzschineria merdigallinarum]|uniref:Uncharacterized protein n=1 Tax=Candidatus Ignatzschineria merdigallinarum TaxID=2838621 RepID=A0A9D1Q6F4_9GAMM|nr:hypothetical protein [Candidatus Ignatzschineria merdigallinarum]